MKISKKVGLIIFSIFLCFILLPVNGWTEDITVEPWFVESMENSQATLSPGTTTYCNKDFVVENLGDEMAEVHIIRGSGDNYDRDMIPSKGKVSYKLNDRSMFSTLASEGHHVDEARIINTTMGQASLKIHCK